MAKREPELISKNGYAKYLGINEKAVRNAVNEGKIKKGWDAVNQKIVKQVADKEWGHLHQVVKARPGVSKEKLAAQLEQAEKSEKTVKKPTKVRSKSEGVEEILSSPKKAAEKSEDLPPDDVDLSKLSTADLLAKLEITADMPYNIAIKYNEIVELALKKKKLEEMEDILIRRVDVEKMLYAFGNQLKQALLSIPTRVTDDMMSAANKVEAMNILTEELTAVLDKSAGFANINISNKK